MKMYVIEISIGIISLFCVAAISFIKDESVPINLRLKLIPLFLIAAAICFK